MRFGGALHSVMTILRSRSRAWMQIAMTTRDCPRDVTPLPADVSKNVMEVAWCNRASESRYSTACVELCTLERGSLTQSNSTSAFKRPSVQDQAQLPSEDEEACRHVPREYWKGKRQSPLGELASKWDWKQQRRQRVVWRCWKQATQNLVGFF